MPDLILLFLKGLGLGIAVAAPVGPVGALCIRRAVHVGRASAIISGMGAAVADAFYGAVAAFGLTAISAFLIQYQNPAAVIGGVFLIYLAVKILRSAGDSSASANQDLSGSLWSGFLTTFLLTIVNPATILSFVAIFAGIGFINTGGNPVSAVSLVSGVFLGSALWWVFLAFLAIDLQKRLGPRFTSLVNFISAAIIGLFGLVALASLFSS